MNAFLIWLAVALAPPAAAAPPPQMSETEAVAVRQAEERGAMMYAYDQAAWHGTDDLMAKLPDFASRVGGWVVDGPAEAPELVFYDRDRTDPHAIYVADFRNNRLVSSKVLGATDDRTLSPHRKAMIAAREAGIAALAASDAKRCVDKPFNTVVLPPEQPGGPTLVYLLTPQTRMDAIPFGGHYRIEVSADGKAAAPRHFTNSCLEMPRDPPQKGKPGVIFVTHLLDPVPTEIHVFSSLAAHVPVAVGTVSNKHLWIVDGAHIELMSADLTKQ